MGIYHIGDYIRFLWHKGHKYVFWCGSDILNLRWYNVWIFSLRNAEHFCESERERKELKKEGIHAEIRPIFMDNPALFKYKKRETPRSFYICAHEGREEEYGVYLFSELAFHIPEAKFYIYGIKGKSCDNVIYRGILPNDDFNKQIQKHDAFLRYNEFDGFSEATGKAVLLGQKVLDANYPNIDIAWFKKYVNKLPFQV